MIRALLIAAFLVASAAPTWAQSDDRWIAIFANGGTLGKGGDRYGDPGIYHGKNPHVIETMLRRMAIPYKVILLPDSARGWHRQLGDERDTDEADSTHFRKNGCMGWIAFMDNWSISTSAKGYAGELVEVFTDANGSTGAQTGSPADGNWGIPGVVFVGSPTSAAGWSMGISANYGITTHRRNTSTFADNGDSVSTEMQRVFLPAAGEAANYTPIIKSSDFDASNDSLPVLAWRYKTNTLYYAANTDPYFDPKMLMLGLADVLNRAGYVPRRKLNLHIDLDHPFPDSRPSGIPTAASDSVFAYMDRMPWRYGGAYEAHASEVTGGANPDDPVTKAMWSSRSHLFPGDPHSHQYMNFYPNSSTWNMTTFADSATKRARWNSLRLAIKDTLQVKVATGYEQTATFPDNNVYFPDLYIFASGGYRNIRSKSFATSSNRDSIGSPPYVNLRRAQQVPGPRTYSSPLSTFGLPYMYIEPKTNLPLYVHDSVESPTSSDSLSTGATDYSVSMEGFASRNLSSLARMAIFDGGAYWHPDLNVANVANNGPLMATFYRRLTYFYGRVKNIVTVEPVYRPKTPRTGGTAR